MHRLHRIHTRKERVSVSECEERDKRTDIGDMGGLY